ncbi:MAG: SURF1 family protein [Pseudomonadota bacterium]
MALRFAPPWYFILLTAAAVPGFIALGFWQWHRGEHRRDVWQQFARSDVEAIEANAASLQELPLYTRVRVSGQFDTARQILLDNISRQGQPGYEVLAVLRLADGSALLVNRGWLQFSGYRDRLPDVAFEATGESRLTGRLSTLPVPGMAAGRQAPALSGPWPRVTSFPQRADIEAALGEKLLPPLLLLDADSGPGYVRTWQAPGISPDRNFNYAFQWWLFALLALGLFIGLNLKRVK